MSIPPYWKPYLDEFYEMVGDPVKDKALLAEESPVMHVDKIKTPLFVAQGAQIHELIKQNQIRWWPV